MSRIIIIGGGMAGLTAGIFAQKFGFQSEIYEAHKIVGGECTGWTREGFHIDNCIHWMTGTRKNTDLYKMWHETDALTDDTEIIMSDAFYTSYVGGKKLSMYYDTEKTRRELIEAFPEDKKAINAFIKAVRISEKLKMPVDMPMDLLPKFKMLILALSMLKGLRLMKKYGAMTIREFIQNFHSPMLKTFLTDYLPGAYSAFALIASYATFTGDNGGIPKGGSLKLVHRMAKKYQSLGGVIHTSAPVASINIRNGHADSITLSDGKEVSGDYIVPTCDPSITFSKLMDRKYMPKELAERYQSMLVNAQFQVAFGVDDPCDFLELSQYFDCEPLTIAHTEITRIGVRNYNYDPSFAPEGKAVLQTSVRQEDKDYEFWENLYLNDRERYHSEKNRIAQEMLRRILRQYPQLTGKIRIIDSCTPYTYHRFVGAYKGGYMNFIYSPEVVTAPSLTGLIDGVDNVYLGTQWLQMPGGLPCAASCGKFAIQRIKAAGAGR